MSRCIKVTVHETLQLHELIRLESSEVQKVQAILPMVADEDLRRELTTCLQTGKAHVKALVDFCKANQLAEGV